MIKKDRLGFYIINLKVANMRKSQEFVLYPKVTDFGEVWLQSDYRFMSINIFDGRSLISKCNKESNGVRDLKTGIPFNIDPSILEALKDHYKDHPAGTNQIKSNGVTILTY